MKIDSKKLHILTTTTDLVDNILEKEDDGILFYDFYYFTLENKKYFIDILVTRKRLSKYKYLKWEESISNYKYESGKNIDEYIRTKMSSNNKDLQKGAPKESITSFIAKHMDNIPLNKIIKLHLSQMNMTLTDQ